MYCLRFCCHILKTNNTANVLFKACLCHKADIYIYCNYKQSQQTCSGYTYNEVMEYELLSHTVTRFMFDIF